MITMKTLIAGAFLMSATVANAAGWSLNTDLSAVNFGSIKNGSVGESHGFESMSGTVDAEGHVSVMLDLASVQTNIDIRNERMIEHVFAGAAQAELTATVDIAEMTALAVGDAVTTEIDGTLNLLGVEVPLYVNVFVLRMSDEQVMVTTDGMTFFTTEEASIDGGIDVLQGLAGLDSITRVVPVSFRLIFDAS